MAIQHFSFVRKKIIYESLMLRIIPLLAVWLCIYDFPCLCDFFGKQTPVPPLLRYLVSISPPLPESFKMEMYCEHMMDWDEVSHIQILNLPLQNQNLLNWTFWDISAFKEKQFFQFLFSAEDSGYNQGMCSNAPVKRLLLLLPPTYGQFCLDAGIPTSPW